MVKINSFGNACSELNRCLVWCPHRTRVSTEQTVFSEQEKHLKKNRKKFINHKKNEKMKDSFSSFRKVATVALVLIGLVFAGCEKMELTNPENIQKNANQEVTLSNLPILKVENGVLCFEDEKQFFNTIELLGKVSEDVRIEWEKSIGFKSYYSIYDEITDSILLCKNKEEIDEIVKNNSNILKIEDNTVKSHIIDYEYVNIIDPNGYFIIKNYIYKIIENYIVRTDMKYKNIIEKNINIDDLINLNNDNLTIYKYFENIPTKDNQYYQTAIGYNDDFSRKLEFYVGTKKWLTETNHYKMNIIATTVPYKWYLGRYHNYKTYIRILVDESECNVPYQYINGSWTWHILSADDIWGGYTLKDSKSLTVQNNLCILTANPEPPRHYFTNLTARTYTRGVYEWQYVYY